MWKLLLGLLKGGDGRKSVAGGLAWEIREAIKGKELDPCLLYTSPSPRDRTRSRMPSSA